MIFYELGIVSFAFIVKLLIFFTIKQREIKNFYGTVTALKLRSIIPSVYDENCVVIKK